MKLGKDKSFVEAAKRGNGLTAIVLKSRFEMTEEEVQGDLALIGNRNFKHKYLVTEEDKAWEKLRVSKTVKDEMMKLDSNHSYVGYSSTTPQAPSYLHTDHPESHKNDGLN